MRSDIEQSSVFSSYNGNDLAAVEAQIMAALTKYNELNQRYTASVALGSGHARWAKSNLLPGVNAAKSSLDTLTKQKEAMLSSMGIEQHIDLVDTVTNEATTPPENELPWKTIGLAVGAIVVIVVIYKVI